METIGTVLDKDVERMLGRIRRPFKSNILPEYQRRMSFLSQSEKRRAKKKPRTKTSQRLKELNGLFSENVIFLRSLGVSSSPMRRRRGTIYSRQSPTTNEANELQELAIEARSVGVSVPCNWIGKDFPVMPTPAVETELPMVDLSVESELTTQPTVVTPIVASIEYHTSINMIRFISDNPQQPVRFPLVWNIDRQWPSFPGGGLENGESPAEAAQRETVEEIRLETKPKMIGRLKTSPYSAMAICTADLPAEQIAHIQWGVEQRKGQKVQTVLRTVTAKQIDTLIVQGKFMPNHVAIWEFYKKHVLK